MSKPIVILAPRVTDDSVSIWRTCIRLGWSPLRMQTWRVSDEVKNSASEVMIYGEPIFAEAVVDQLGLVLLEPSIDWLPKLPFKYSKRKVDMMTLEEARKISTKCFFKPADGKIFDPKVYVSGKDLPNENSVDLSIPVLRSEIVDYQLEVRCFVRERSIVTHSPYWRNEELAQDVDGNWSYIETEEAEAIEFANSVLSDPEVLLLPACTLDVGRSTAGEWSVIEANPCWGAGLYGCDPEEVLKTIGVAVKKADSLSPEDVKWVLARA